MLHVHVLTGIYVLDEILLWMDRLVRLFHGEKVRSDGKYESMKEVNEFFSTPPTFGCLVSQCRQKFRGGAFTLKGRFDYGKERAHYVVMSLSCEQDWSNYKEVVMSM